ncbi:hypothetical protein AMJ49_03315 [Parcubacteria bacterium DG_74_2]|nr:MAG: hypothetical protein AMJ49_03315 [Parcubacteria bacterium DG_74_2]
MVYFLTSLFWFIREVKAILFWLYLWQLKEYHLGRFLDHFRTEKGKRILFLPIFKIFLIPVFIFFKFIFPVLLTIFYFLESGKVFFDIFQKKLKKPVFTKKMTFLIFFCFGFQTFYLLSVFQKTSIFTLWLLVFDILTPAIASGILLFFQPLTVLIRNKIIKKAKEKRKKFKDLIVIGITGSYGKTSTKEFLATILSEKFKVLKTLKHQNSEVAISQCVLNDLKKEHQVFVVEMGSYNRGGIKLLADICKPKIGILTGINEQHMATFGSQENIIKTKFELIESLPEDGLAILNEESEKIKNQKSKIKTYNPKLKNIRFCSKKETSDIWAEDIKIEKEFISFKALSQDGDFAQFTLNLFGAQDIENLLLAALCAKELGMKLSEISKASQKIKPEQGGMKLVKAKKGLDIIDSTYSANPDGVIAHLDYLKIWEGKKAIVMPCLIELGRASKEVHERIGEKIGKVCDLAIITTKDRFKETKKGFIKSGQKEENILFIEEPKEIVEKIKTFYRENDVILLEGRIQKKVIELLKY